MPKPCMLLKTLKNLGKNYIHGYIDYYKKHLLVIDLEGYKFSLGQAVRWSMLKLIVEDNT